MVFYFTSSVVPTVYTIYMGKDKYENEDLIKYGWPEDIWFHVDKLSSAHVYLRLHKGQTVDDIPKEVLIDCAHLVKANSIQGCKMNNVNVVYTPWTNLKKTADMDVGQIGFHRQKDVKMLTVEKKVNEILNRLEKTKVERFPDLAAEKEARDREERNEKKAQIQEMKRKEKEEMKKKKELEELRSYSSLMKAENMSSNQDTATLLGLLREPRGFFVTQMELGMCTEPSQSPSHLSEGELQAWSCLGIAWLESRRGFLLAETCTCHLAPSREGENGWQRFR